MTIDLHIFYALGNESVLYSELELGEGREMVVNLTIFRTGAWGG